jgi:hypothetical protein
MTNKNNIDRNTRNKKTCNETKNLKKNQRQEQRQNKSEQIKQDYIKYIYIQ